MPGLDKVPIRWPDKWDPAFMDRLVRDTLAKADVRNAVSGLGISVTGQSDEPATISGSEDVQQLFDAGLILADPEPLLPNARQLTVLSPLSLEDEGAGGNVEISIPDGNVPLDKLQNSSALSVAARPSNSAGPLSYLDAAANDTVLQRTSDTLFFGQLTVGMAADGLWTVTKLSAGVQASLALADTAVQPADVTPIASAVAALPGTSTNVPRRFVTDALTPAFLAPVVGGGAVYCPVFYNGAAWVVG